MSRIVDFILYILKWPAALFLLFSAPALWQSFDHFNFLTARFYALGGGIIVYVLTILIAGYDVCSNMQIISHELTHTVFAYLTLHSAGRIRLNPDGSGGSMMIRKGMGNWIIALSPYFFPLFAAIYMIIMPALLIMSGNHWLVYAVLGYFVAYYWATVISQVHPKQTDIIGQGYVFSAIIIITLNLLTTGILLAYTSQSWHGVDKYLNIVNKHNIQNLQNFASLILQYFQ